MMACNNSLASKYCAIVKALAAVAANAIANMAAAAKIPTSENDASS